ncbi:MAG: hypothetical protein LBU38_06055 [Propionibacteriaceae bacterium]|nr:hypothetical protein [Propionibacteriaceae bacterium]
MRRILSAALVAAIAPVILVGAIAIPAYAATEGEVMANIYRGVTINGQHRDIAPQYIKMAKDYLAEHRLTPEQLDKLNALINSTRSTWEANGTTTYLDTPSKDKKTPGKSQPVIANATDNASYQAQPSGEGTDLPPETIDSTGATSEAGTLIDDFFKRNGVDEGVKQVDVDYMPAVSLLSTSALALAGAAFVVFRTRLSNRQ